MKSYEDTMQQLSDMRSRFDSGFSYSDRSLLEELHRNLYGKGITNTGCSDCYRDAYIVIFNHLKQSKTMPTKPNYILKAGALIHPAGTSKFYANAIPDEVAEDHLGKFPSDIIRFAHYPEDWETRVAAYKERIENEKSKCESAKAIAEVDAVAPVSSEEDKKTIESLKAQIDEVQKAKSDTEAKLSEAEEKIKLLEIDKTNLSQQIDGLTSALENNFDNTGDDVEKEDVSEEIAQLRIELETAKIELESAREEIANLKNDNRALKAANTRLKNSGAKDAE